MDRIDSPRLQPRSRGDIPLALAFPEPPPLRLAGAPALVLAPAVLEPVGLHCDALRQVARRLGHVLFESLHQHELNLLVYLCLL